MTWRNWINASSRGIRIAFYFVHSTNSSLIALLDRTYAEHYSSDKFKMIIDHIHIKANIFDTNTNVYTEYAEQFVHEYTEWIGIMRDDVVIMTENFYDSPLEHWNITKMVLQPSNASVFSWRSRRKGPLSSNPQPVWKG